MYVKKRVAIASLLTLVILALLIGQTVKAEQHFRLYSPAFLAEQTLPAQFTCEGEGISPPLSWSGVPSGTQSLVMIMDHQPPRHTKPQNNSEINAVSVPNKIPHTTPDSLRWYWSIYNIPTSVRSLNAGASFANKPVTGQLGNNVVNGKNTYAPPCSKGPGLKKYRFHLYALSSTLSFSHAEDISAALLRARMAGHILATDSLTVNFERNCQLTSIYKPPVKGDMQKMTNKKPPLNLPLCRTSKNNSH